MGITNPSHLAELEAEICAIATSMARQDIRLLRLVGEFDAEDGWVAADSLSCAHWLADTIDIELSTAREKVRVARALRSLPLARERFERGELSYAKVRQLTRVATASNEGEIVQLATRHTASHLPRVLAAWQQHHEPEAFAARRRSAQGVTFRDEPTGNRTVVAQLPIDQAAVLEALIDAEVANPPADEAAHDPDTRAPLRHRRVDALVRLIGRWAASDASADASEGRLRPELMLHRRVGETTLADGSVLPRAVARYYSCDADVRVMTHYPDGSPADVGRRHRLVTRRLRMLVLERDGYRCQQPGCGSRRHLDVHHVVHWEDGGPTDIGNLITYCAYHHRRLHEADLDGARAAPSR